MQRLKKGKKMYKTELINKVLEAYTLEVKLSETQLNSCQAWLTNVFINGKRYFILRSYNTLVAVYSCMTDIVYVFDYYSSTTCQHVSKFTKLMRADKRINLYADSRTSKKARLLNESEDYNSFILED